MNSTDAADLVNRTIFRPGWKFSASRASDTEIEVTIRVETVNSSYPDSDGTYSVPMQLIHDVSVDVSAIAGELTLLALLLRYAHAVDEHEDREFLRTRQHDGTFRAPFHPHSQSGEFRYMLADAAAELLP